MRIKDPQSGHVRQATNPYFSLTLTFLSLPAHPSSLSKTTSANLFSPLNSSFTTTGLLLLPPLAVFSGAHFTIPLLNRPLEHRTWVPSLVYYTARLWTQACMTHDTPQEWQRLEVDFDLPIIIIMIYSLIIIYNQWLQWWMWMVKYNVYHYTCLPQ